MCICFPQFPEHFFSDHFKVVLPILNKTSKLENVESMDATTEGCSEKKKKKDLLKFFKNKSKLLSIYKKLFKITREGVDFW